MQNLHKTLRYDVWITVWKCTFIHHLCEVFLGQPAGFCPFFRTFSSPDFCINIFERWINRMNKKGKKTEAETLFKAKIFW